MDVGQMLTKTDGGGRGGPGTPDFGWRNMWTAPNRIALRGCGCWFLIINQHPLDILSLPTSVTVMQRIHYVVIVGFRITFLVVIFCCSLKDGCLDCARLGEVLAGCSDWGLAGRSATLADLGTAISSSSSSWITLDLQTPDLWYGGSS